MGELTKGTDGMERLTREQAAIVGAYTGVLSGPFSDMHKYVEKVMERPVWTHEMGDKAITTEIRAKSKPDFLAIVAQ